MVTRRTFVHTSLALLAVGCSSTNPLVTAIGSVPSRKTGTFRCFVPGYRPSNAHLQGRSVINTVSWRKNIPSGYEGPLTMLTRLDGKNEPRRAIYPIQGHGVCLNPDGRTGFFAANNYPDSDMVAFDTDSLETVKIVPVNRKGWYGGGHAKYSHDGANLFISERSPERAFSGKLKDHYGVITVRDASTYKVVSEYSCHGIAPHEITLTADGRYLLVANYGSTRPRGLGKNASLPEILEPSITVLEVASGRLIDKIIGSNKENEIRHLAAIDLQRIFAIQVKLGDDQELFGAMQSSGEVYERDMTASKNRAFLPAYLLRVISERGGGKATEIKGMNSLLTRHGLSIIYEPNHNEILATYPSSHTLMIVDASSGQLKHQIRTDHLGLRFPCGLALHPDKKHYIVTGHWRDMYVFERGKHIVNREACQYVSLFGHSHIVV